MAQKMNFIVAEVKVLQFRILNKSKKVFLEEGNIVTVSTVDGGEKNGTLKVWYGDSVYLDYQKYYELDYPVRIIKK